MRVRAVILSLLGFLVVLNVSTVRADVQRLGPNLFAAGVPSDQFEFFAAASQAGRQRQSNWCWAASVQMVLNY